MRPRIADRIIGASAGENIGNRYIGGDQEGCTNGNCLNTYQVTVVPQEGDDWRGHCVRLCQEGTQPLYVGGMAKVDIGDHHGHGRRGGPLFVQPDHSTRVMTAKPMSQFPASVWTIRNQKDRTVAGHGCCTGLADGIRVENGAKFHIGPKPANI